MPKTAAPVRTASRTNDDVKDAASFSRWFRSALQNGYAEAQYQIGLHALSRQDYNSAIKWFHRAADQNHADAQYQYARLCEGWGERGIGEQDIVSLYLKAAENGSKEALSYLKRLVARESEKNIPPDLYSTITKAIWNDGELYYPEKVDIYEYFLNLVITIKKETGLDIPDAAMPVVAAQIMNLARGAAATVGPPAGQEMLTTDAVKPKRVQWVDRKGENKESEDATLSAPDFIRKHYAAEIAAGTLTQALVRRDDPKLYEAFYSWRRSHRDTPLGFEFPKARQSREAKYAELYGDAGAEVLATQREADRRRMEAVRKRAKER